MAYRVVFLVGLNRCVINSVGKFATTLLFSFTPSVGNSYATTTRRRIDAIFKQTIKLLGELA